MNFQSFSDFFSAQGKAITAGGMERIIHWLSNSNEMEHSWEFATARKKKASIELIVHRSDVFATVERELGNQRINFHTASDTYHV
jgi:hypothetical protein